MFLGKLITNDIHWTFTRGRHRSAGQHEAWKKGVRERESYSVSDAVGTLNMVNRTVVSREVYAVIYFA